MLIENTNMNQYTQSHLSSYLTIGNPDDSKNCSQ